MGAGVWGRNNEIAKASCYHDWQVIIGGKQFQFVSKRMSNFIALLYNSMSVWLVVSDSFYSLGMATPGSAVQQVLVEPLGGLPCPSPRGDICVYVHIYICVYIYTHIYIFWLSW